MGMPSPRWCWILQEGSEGSESQRVLRTGVEAGKTSLRFRVLHLFEGRGLVVIGRWPLVSPCGLRWCNLRRQCSQTDWGTGVSLVQHEETVTAVIYEDAERG